MKMNRLFTFDVSVINDLNDEIRKGLRSKFVNDALKQKLYGDQHKPLAEHSSLRLMKELTRRDDVPDIIKRMLQLELDVPRP